MTVNALGQPFADNVPTTPATVAAADNPAVAPAAPRKQVERRDKQEGEKTLTKPLLQVIIGSTRPGRAGGPVADWFAAQARVDDRFDVEIIDLAEVGLPLLDEPNHPRLRDYQHEHTKAWSAIIDRADAFVFVIPEYNYAINAATKNAIDYLFHEWAHKPLGIVSYGGISGGLRAAQILKQIGTALKMVTMPDTVIIPMIGTLRTPEGGFAPTPIIEDSAVQLLDQLSDLTESMSPLRERILTAAAN